MLNSKVPWQHFCDNFINAYSKAYIQLKLEVLNYVKKKLWLPNIYWIKNTTDIIDGHQLYSSQVKPVSLTTSIHRKHVGGPCVKDVQK